MNGTVKESVEKRSFLQSLDIKESITINEVTGLAVNRPTFQAIHESTTRGTALTGIDKIMKQSLKQSITLNHSNEFEFDF